MKKCFYILLISAFFVDLLGQVFAEVTITKVTFHSKMEMADGTDNWPCTWGDDDKLYVVGGDGNGFGGSRKSAWFCAVTGNPPGISGKNVKALSEGDGGSGKKGSGLLMVNGVIYLWMRNANNSGKQCQLWWSSDHGKSWSQAGWKFEELGYCCFLNFGKHYSGARDNYVYVYSPNTSSAYNECDNVVLARVPNKASDIKSESKYEFFTGLDGNGKPTWGSIGSRKAVFTKKGGCNRMDVVYNKPLGLYIMTMRSRARAGGLNHFSIQTSTEPWGPWKEVYYLKVTSSNNSAYPGDNQHFPSKWMSSDGKTMYMLCSASDAFTVQKVTLTVEGKPAVKDTSPPSVPGSLSAKGLLESTIKLTWTTSNDAESGVTGYRIKRNGTEITTISGLEYTDKGLKANTKYSYTVEAKNGVGLYSKPASASATTAAPSIQFDLAASHDRSSAPLVCAKAQFAVHLPEASGFALKVFDIAGSEVWSYSVAHAQAGMHRIAWGASPSSRPNNGLYFIVLHSQGKHIIERFVITQ